MIQRSSGVLLATYLILAVAGVVFLFAPSRAVENVAHTDFTTIIWGLFYLIGGVFSATSVILRGFVKHTLPLWLFELSGIFLIIAANFVYAYALVALSTTTHEYNAIATALIMIGFSGGLVARSVETLRLVRVLKQFAQEE